MRSLAPSVDSGALNPPFSVQVYFFFFFTLFGFVEFLCFASQESDRKPTSLLQQPSPCTSSSSSAGIAASMPLSTYVDALKPTGVRSVNQVKLATNIMAEPVENSPPQPKADFLDVDFPPETAAEAAFEEWRGKRGLRVLRERTALELERLQQEENELRRLLSRIDPNSFPPQFLEDFEERRPKPTLTLKQRLGLSSLVKEIRTGVSTPIASVVSHQAPNPAPVQDGPNTVKEHLSITSLTRPRSALASDPRVTPALARRPVSASQLRKRVGEGEELPRHHLCFARPSSATLLLRRIVEPTSEYEVASPNGSAITHRRSTHPGSPSLSPAVGGSPSTSVRPSSAVTIRHSKPNVVDESSPNGASPASSTAAPPMAGGTRDSYRQALAAQQRMLGDLKRRDDQYQKLLQHQAEHSSMVGAALRQIIDICVPADSQGNDSEGTIQPKSTRPALRGHATLEGRGIKPPHGIRWMPNQDLPTKLRTM
jgi:hypothetical protein